MKALDTNVLVRLLVNDDRAQAGKAKALLERAESGGEQFFVTFLVVLELMWVLSASYRFERSEVIEALRMLSGLPVLSFEDYDGIIDLIELASTNRADLPDLLIGLRAKACGCDATLTFEKRLARTPLFESL